MPSDRLPPVTLDATDPEADVVTQLIIAVGVLEEASAEEVARHVRAPSEPTEIDVVYIRGWLDNLSWGRPSDPLARRDGRYRLNEHYVPRPDPDLVEGIPTCVYRFFDATGQLLYVGVTNALPLRLDRHNRTKPWFRDCTKVTVEHFEDRTSALEAEARAIRRERPVHNVLLQERGL